MATRFESLIPDDENPYVTDAMKRRSQPPVESEYAGPRTITDDSSGLSRRVRSAGENFASYGDALQGLGNKLLGDEEGAQRQFAEYQRGQERARAIGPDVQSLEDVQRRGGTLGAYGEFAATQAVNFAPDIIATVASGGLGGAAAALARRGGVRLAEAGVKKAVTRELAEKVAETGSAAARADLAVVTAARTPRKELLDATADLATTKAKQASAQRAGQLGGATVGQYPGVVADSAQALQETDREGAAKIAGVDVLSAAFGSLPAERFLGRITRGIGGEVAKDGVEKIARKMLPSVAKEFGTQGALEGGIGVGQAVIQLAGHKWVNDNVDLLGPEAFDRYLAEAVGGFLAGGALSGAHTAGSVGIDKWREGAEGRGEKFDALKARLAKNLQAAGAAARAKADKAFKAGQARVKPGDPVNPDGSAQTSAPSGEGDVQSTFSDVYSKVKGGVGTAAGAVSDKFKSVVDRFKNTEETIQNDEDTDALARQTYANIVRDFESGEADAPLANFVGTRAANTNPVKLDNGLQNILATVFPKNDDIWQQPEAARSIMRSVEKIFTGDKRTKRDDRNIARMQSWFPEHVAKWEAVGPEYARAMQLAQQATREQGESADNTPSELQQEELTANPFGDISEQDAAGAGAGLRETNIVDKLSRTPKDDPNYAAIRKAAREQVMGGPLEHEYPGGNEGIVVKERLDKPDFFSNKTRGADTVLMRETFRMGGKEMRKAVDLGSLISRQRGSGDTKLSMRDALLKGLGELRATGVKLYGNTFKPGTIELKDGSKLRILPRDGKKEFPDDVFVQELQGTVGAKSADAAVQKSAYATREAAKARKEVLRKRVRDASSTPAQRLARESRAAEGAKKAAALAAERAAKARAEIADATALALARGEAPPRITRRQASALREGGLSRADKQRLNAAEVDSDVTRKVRERTLERKDGVGVGGRDPKLALPGDTRDVTATKRSKREDKREMSNQGQIDKQKYEQGPRERPPVQRVQPRPEKKGPQTKQEAGQAAYDAVPTHPALKKLLGTKAERAYSDWEATNRNRTENGEAGVPMPAEARAFAEALGKDTAARNAAAAKAEKDFKAPDTRRSNELIPTIETIGDVIIDTPHEKTVIGALKSQQEARTAIAKAEADKARLKKRQSELENGATPRNGDEFLHANLRKAEAKIERATEQFDNAQVDAGRAIGLAHLQKKLDNGQLSNRAYGKQRKELMNPRNQDVALKYFDDARDGNIDTSSKVIETAVDVENTQKVGIKGRDPSSVAKVEERIKAAYGTTSDISELAPHLGKVLARMQARKEGPLYNILNARVSDAKTSVLTFKEAFNRLPPPAQDNYRLIREAMRSYDELPPSHPIRKVIDDAAPEWQQRINAGDPIVSGPDPLLKGKAVLDLALSSAKPVTNEGRPQNRAERRAASQEAVVNAKAPAAKSESKSTAPAEKVTVPKLTARERADAEAAREAKRVARGETPAQARARETLEAQGLKKDAEQFDENISDGVDAATGDGPHDHKAETNMLNALLKRMGFKDEITVKPMPAERLGKAGEPGGSYRASEGTIFINPNLKGKERIEVLAHELGHHVLRAELAKYSDGLSPKDFANLPEDVIFDMLKTVNPELHAGLKADFDAWTAKNPTSTRVVDARASRAPQHRAKALLARNTRSKQTIESLSVEKQQYAYSMDEYFADQIARALTSKKEATTVVEKFFKQIADQLRTIYDALFTKGNKKWAPAPSVDKWVQSLFDANVRDVQEATGGTTSVEGAVATIEAAVRTNALVPTGKPPPRVGKPRDAGPRTVAAMVKYVRTVMQPKERKILEDVLNRGTLVAQLRKIYADNPRYRRALDSANFGLESRIALAYIAWKQGKLNTGPAGSSALINVDDNMKSVMGIAGKGELAQRIFDDVASGKLARERRIGKDYDARADAERVYGKVNRAANKVSDFKEKYISEPLSKFWDSKLSRAWGTGVPSMRKLASLIQRPQGTTGDDPGMTPAAVHKTAQMLRKASQAFEGLSERETVAVMSHLQRGPASPSKRPMKPKEKAAVAKVRALMDEAFAYAKEAGVDLGSRSDYFPVLIDLRNEQAAAKLTALYSKPEYEAPIRDLFSTKDADGNRVPSDKPIEQLVKNLVDGAAHGPTGLTGGASTGAGTPNFKGANYRLSQFIYDGKNADDIKLFASLQSKDPADVLSRYIEPLVRRAEYARRFGDDGAKVEALFKRARREGATEAQIEEARNTLKAALGTYGAEGSPTLAAISPALAARFSGPRSKRFIQGAQAYQNARLLPLATLSSLVDPIGIAVRSGGDFKVAWDGFKLGIKSLYDKGTREDIHALLATLGSTEDMGGMDSLNRGLGGGETPFSKKLNEAVFRYNGLQGWTRATRYMALEAAHGFLTKHADGTGRHSVRYFDELGLQQGDVRKVFEANVDGSAKLRVDLLSPEERAQATPKERARDDRVRNAMLQFVDEAILRPNSQQVPQWYSDPYMGLVTQYKAFAYALFDQIGGRIGRELKQGNAAVMLPALMYLPITVMAELLRELLQYGPEGDPRRKSWGAYDYAFLAAEKNLAVRGPKYEVQANVFKDALRRSVPGSSQVGPTGGQVRDAVGSDPGKAFESALPASALWRKWNDDRGSDERDAA